MQALEMPPPVVVLAGGIGSRLRPLTEALPKPLIPVGGRPLLSRIVSLLRSQGFSRVLVAANYLGHKVAEYLERTREAEPRILDSKDTVDGVRLLLDELGGEAVVAVGDALTNADVMAEYRYHSSVGADATILLKGVDNPLQFGLVFVDDRGRVTLFAEKPASLEIYVLSLAFHRARATSMYSNLVNAGFYVLGEEALRLIALDRSILDFGRHLFPLMVERGFKVYGYVAPPSTYWEDVGTLERYKRAVWDLISGSVPGQEPDGKPLPGGAYAHPEAEVRGEVVPPAYIGRGAVVEEGAVVGPYASLEGPAIVRRGARLHRAILWAGSEVGEGSVVVDSLILGARVGPGAKVVGSVVKGW